MFEDDEDDDYQMTEAEEWYDNNLGYFDWKNRPAGMPMEVELFYYSVYRPFMSDLKKPLQAMISRHYPYIGGETRPEVLEKIQRYIDRVGHDFLLNLRRAIEHQKTGGDLRELYPELDDWAKKYPTYRQPRYTDESFWDNMEWLTPEVKAELIAESRKEAEETFQFKEKPRFEFFSLLQQLAFGYYPEIQDIDSDGWTMYDVFLYDEYINYRLDFEHYDEFIKYGFGVEDLNLPYAEYQAKFSERWKLRHDEEIRKKMEEEQNKPGEE
jgi:hypothetical protein